MKYVSTLLLAGACCQAMAQVPTLPYNSDWNNNGIIETVALMQLLSDYGELFFVEEITIDEVVFSEWLQAISETVIQQQAQIDSLQYLGRSCLRGGG